MLTLRFGRWSFHIINPECVGWWAWKRPGYDSLWDEWAFGFWLNVEHETDWLLQQAKEYPAPPGTPKRRWFGVYFSWPDFG